MNLVKYNTYRDDYSSSVFDGFVNRFFNSQMDASDHQVKFIPNADIFENNNSYEIQVALPGLKKDEIELNISESKLSISGEKKMTKKSEEYTRTTFETNYGTFKRSFKLPKHIDQSSIEASYTDGILSIVLPKVAEDKLKTKVKIK